MILDTLNVNSFSGKFDQIKTFIQGNIDIFIVTESKLNETFPAGQFFMDGFNPPYRLDGGGVLIYVREGIPSKPLNLHIFPEDIEGIFVEINLSGYFCVLTIPPSQPDQYYFDCLGRALDKHAEKYDNFLLSGDFNAEEW